MINNYCRHSWDTVVEAAWKKYPNPWSKAVKAIDVLDRHVDEKGILKTHRLMTTQWGFPGWAKKVGFLFLYVYFINNDKAIFLKYAQINSVVAN